MQGLWGFVAQHDSQIEHVVARLPSDLPIWLLAENAKNVKSELSWGFMLRLIDLKAAFEQRTWPVDICGSFSLYHRDDQAPWNHGSWRFEFEGGRCRVSAGPTDVADLETSVQTLSQLYSGIVTPRQAMEWGRLGASDPRAVRLMEQLMAGVPFHFYEGF
jgi:predicted acetyltransferase